MPLKSYTEDISQTWFALAFAVMRQKRLSVKEKELCILAVLSRYDAPYVHYAHSEIAVRVGFTKVQVQSALHGKLPEELDERESSVYNLSLHLANQRRPMEDSVFEEARKTLGRDEIVGVAHIVSGYIYVAMLTNISNQGVPEAGEDMFQATKNPKL